MLLLLQKVTINVHCNSALSRLYLYNLHFYQNANMPAIILITATNM